ncbi:hypothetical protein Q8A67_018378 [Cirrhinus molitorella]|uniref:Uncharacterized protein n=1 Tax=Cirrhinus molitorella TaxID=172907 RepID=A0AA88PCL5_9TELE|nr:hypothetical protein Q8A67_018378 [Cirrhinus molitorella]
MSEKERGENVHGSVNENKRARGHVKITAEEEAPFAVFVLHTTRSEQLLSCSRFRRREEVSPRRGWPERHAIRHSIVREQQVGPLENEEGGREEFREV